MKLKLEEVEQSYKARVVKGVKDSFMKLKSWVNDVNAKINRKSKRSVGLKLGGRVRLKLGGREI